jgi:SAM-dependent methyltransferase
MDRYLNYVLTRCDRFWRCWLCLFFRFSWWHTISLRERPYARDIINYLNGRPPAQRTSALEIGCGLGDIIRHIRFEKRVGLDSNNNVLRAARFLSRFNFGIRIRFMKFDFPDSNFFGRYDAIIMVNWIHTICPDVLKQKIEDYARENLSEGGMIIIDTVQDAEYKYHHDVAALTADLECRILSLGPYRRGREIHVITPLTR